jgi:hypothetical protein
VQFRILLNSLCSVWHTDFYESSVPIVFISRTVSVEVEGCRAFDLIFLFVMDDRSPMVFNASKRRQYHSCDRCRKGHRSCDANTSGAHSSGENVIGLNNTYACSACRRANKECTFEWLQSISPSALPANQRFEFAMPVRSESNVIGLTAPNDIMNYDLSPSAQLPTSNEPTEPGLTSTYASSANSQILPLPDCGGQIIHSTGLTTSNSVPMPDILLSTQFSILNENTEPNSMSTYVLSSGNTQIPPLPDYGQEHLCSTRAGLNSLSEHNPINDATNNGKTSTDHDNLTLNSTTFDLTHILAFGAINIPTESWDLFGTLGAYPQNPPTETSTARIVNIDEEAEGGDSTRSGKREQSVITYSSAQSLAQTRDYTFPAPKRKRKLEDLQPDISESATKLIISSSLLKIFEETCENAAFCWSTVYNCPFKIQLPSSIASIGGTSTEPGMSRKSIASGGIWSRAIKLDRKFQFLRPQPLSERDIFQASNSLKLSIMTFASQWGVERKGFRSRTKSSSSFAHLMYRSLWNEATRALDRCSHLNSFRVILSALMMTLVIEPMDEDEIESSATANTRIPRDWRPIAFKHLLFWNQQLSNGILVRRDSFNFTLNTEYYNIHRLSEEDIEDFFLVFWLAMAYDSVLSVLMNTPFSLRLDLGSPVSSLGNMPEIQSTGVQSLEGDSELVSKNYWNITHLNQTQFTWTSLSFSLPGTMEMIETALQDTIPTIILHWRNIGTLRSYLTAKNAPPEEIISSSLQVCTHWKRNSDIVMKFCLENYSKLPFKVQTWYIYLYSNWTLGCFLFTEIIEELDLIFQTGYYQQFWRMLTSSHTDDMKKYYAFAFTNLAQVLSENDSIQPEYHEFITESGAHDGQPWPTIFNLCLVKTCEIFLNWIDQFKGSNPNRSNHDAKYQWILQNVNIQELVSLSENCIEQLRVLGWKSPTSSIEIAMLQSRFEGVTKGYLMIP